MLVSTISSRSAWRQSSLLQAAVGALCAGPYLWLTPLEQASPAPQMQMRKLGLLPPEPLHQGARHRTHLAPLLLSPGQARMEIIFGASNASGNNNDPQKSLTLDKNVIATGFQNDGQDAPDPGQVKSLTSPNNFINFCLTTKKPIGNGKQVKTGSCNPAPMGVIAATTNMPSSKFVFPANNAVIDAKKTFTIKMAINHLESGHFVNAANNYFAAPQQVNDNGDIIGHSHVVIEKMTSLNQTKPTDPTKFAFFKGLNVAAKNGILNADVTGGLDEGVYRLASINAAANHQPVLVAVAQHGSLDDMVYFTVRSGGKKN